MCVSRVLSLSLSRLENIMCISFVTLTYALFIHSFSVPHAIDDDDDDASLRGKKAFFFSRYYDRALEKKKAFEQRRRQSE